MTKKNKRDKHKPRKGRGRGASNVASVAVAVHVPTPEDTPAEQQLGSLELQDVLKVPERLKAPNKPQKDNRNTIFGGRNDTAQLRAKAGAQMRKMQGQRNGNR
ncbi:MAG: hypothetical protein HGA19_06500 [Oscillochloris sp.]|nr:hypothetical protein [Oscillochloris sp.]